MVYCGKNRHHVDLRVRQRREYPGQRDIPKRPDKALIRSLIATIKDYTLDNSQITYELRTKRSGVRIPSGTEQKRPDLSIQVRFFRAYFALEMG